MELPCNKSILRAAERFYAELSDNNRELVVNRAVTLYDGKATREEPHDDDILICDSCGSRQIDIQAWVDANSSEYLSDLENGMSGQQSRYRQHKREVGCT